MTPQLQQRLAALRKLLNEIVENAEKATPGPWIVEDMRTRIYVGNTCSQSCGLWHIIYNVDISGLKEAPAIQHVVDARFIAQARTTSPQMARAHINVLDEIEPMLGHKHHTVAHSLAETILESILKEFGL